jgi:ABC-type bacteriocin/lantibiotic exporter with double-glycine peptidase domain
MYHLPAELQSTTAANKFDDFLDQQKQGRKPNLLQYLVFLVKYDLLLNTLLSLVLLVASLAIPQFVQALILYVDPTRNNKNLLVENGIALAAIVTSLQLVVLLTDTGIKSFNRQIGLKLKNALITAIYSKVLRMTAESRQEFSDGMILNMCGNDTAYISLALVGARDLVFTPLKVILVLYFIWKLLSNAVIVSLGFVVFVLIVTVVVGKLNGILLGKLFEQDDKRVSSISEMLKGSMISW